MADETDSRPDFDSRPGIDDELLRETVEAVLRDPWPSHYGHHDPMGTAGANCPACKTQSEIRAKLKAGLQGYR